jgi:hypothetical protein
MTPACLLAARRCERLVREGSARYLRLDIEGAEPLLRAALAEAERSGRPRAIARAAQPLYYLLRREGRHAESVEPLDRVVAAHRRIGGVDGRWTAEWRNELIGLYGRLGRSRELDAICRERLASDTRRHGPRSAEVAWALLTLAWALRGMGRWDDSERLCRDALALMDERFGCDEPRTGWALVGLALARKGAGDLAGAEVFLRRARANWARVGHADRAAAIDELLIDLYLLQRRHREALELTSGNGCPNDERRLRRIERQAALARALGRDNDARRWDAAACELRTSLERCRRERERLGEDEPETPTSSGAAHLTGPIFPSPLL